MPDERGFPTKEEKEARAAYLAAEADAYVNTVVFMKGADNPMIGELRRHAREEFWLKVAPTL